MKAGLQTEKLDEGLYRTTAQNGVTVISESISGVRSVAVGMWVKTKVRDNMVMLVIPWDFETDWARTELP